MAQLYLLPYKEVIDRGALRQSAVRPVQVGLGRSGFGVMSKQSNVEID